MQHPARSPPTGGSTDDGAVGPDDARTMQQMLEPAWAPEVVPIPAATLAVTSGRSAGFRLVSTRRRVDALLRDLVEELAAQGVTETGSATMSVVAVDDAGVGIEVGVVVYGPVVPTETLRVVERPRHEAATLLVLGDPTEHAWGRLRRFTAEVGVVADRRTYVTFQHPRLDDERTWVIQLVQPVAPTDP
jgi:hypothetical protein